MAKHLKIMPGYDCRRKWVFSFRRNVDCRYCACWL